MAVPDGELRITPLVAGAGAMGTPSDCLLTFEDARRIYALALAPGAELQEQGVALWQRQEVRRPLQIRVNGKCIDLRSAGLPSVLGYHAVAERVFVVLAWVRGEIGLFYLDGYEFTLLARLEMWDLRHGGPLDVERLMRARANRGVANEGPTVFTEEPAAEMRMEATVPPWEQQAPEGVATPPPVHSAGTVGSDRRMSEWHRELCLRHLGRIRDRLVGRGARKARQIVSLVIEALELCRCDLAGSRAEVHLLLEGVLGKTLSGGDRNIRDSLDLLCRESPLFHKDGNRCAILFAQLHDVDSELVRRIAVLESEVAGHARQPLPTSDSKSPAIPQATQETTTGTRLAAPSQSGPPQSVPQGDAACEVAKSRLSPHPSNEPAVGTHDAWGPDISVFRVLGLDHPEPSVTAVRAPAIGPAPQVPSLAQEPSVSILGAPSPHAPIAALTKPWRPLYDDPYDPYDPEMESPDSPSRMYFMSRQKPPEPRSG